MNRTSEDIETIESTVTGLEGVRVDGVMKVTKNSVMNGRNDLVYYLKNNAMNVN